MEYKIGKQLVFHSEGKERESCTMVIPREAIYAVIWSKPCWRETDIWTTFLFAGLAIFSSQCRQLSHS